MTQPYDSMMSSSLPTISRPPSQVFTRGTTGAVKTNTNTNTSRQGKSMTPSRRSRPSTRHDGDRRRSTSANHRSHRPYYTSSREDDTVSVSSAPTHSPKKTPSVALKERPASARKQSVVVHKELSKRDESPAPSQDSPKYHIRTAKRVIEGT